MASDPRQVNSCQGALVKMITIRAIIDDIIKIADQNSH
ncbi:hypothetical protein N44_03060 [Microcystis aeruginosa NIES-44]|uniref:Uncharacterized protein n=1 Tax=Microcystis aeruginosa NIES-44 TaxID=449439 RepID=A0A0A1VXM8_MICAE|nr:hypothetical protein N44_03060 [Microcystis aeruginosa NIES-44]